MYLRMESCTATPISLSIWAHIVTKHHKDTVELPLHYALQFTFVIKR